MKIDSLRIQISLNSQYQIKSPFISHSFAVNWLFPQNWISNVDEYLQSFHIHHHSTHSMSIPWYLYISRTELELLKYIPWISHESPMKSPMFLGCPPLPKKALLWPSRWPSPFFPSPVRWETFLGPLGAHWDGAQYGYYQWIVFLRWLRDDRDAMA